MTPTSRKSCTRRTVASTSLVCWSKTRIFHTGGPDGVGVLNPDFGSFVKVESVGLLRFSRLNKAAVCDCWRVVGAEACWGNQKKIMWPSRPRQTCLKAELAILDDELAVEYDVESG